MTTSYRAVLFLYDNWAWFQILFIVSLIWSALLALLVAANHRWNVRMSPTRITTLGGVLGGTVTEITNEEIIAAVWCPTCDAPRCRPCVTLGAKIPMRLLHSARKRRYARKLLRNAQVQMP